MSVLNYESCMVRATLIDLNPVEPKYYRFMISLKKYIGSCNVLSPKICFPKNINAKAFNMLTNQNEAKTMTKHISCDCKRKFNSTTCNSNQKWSNKTCQCEHKNYHNCKKDYSWNPSISISENGEYLKGIANTSAIEWDEIITAMDIVST